MIKDGAQEQDGQRFGACFQGKRHDARVLVVARAKQRRGIFSPDQHAVDRLKRRVFNPAELLKTIPCKHKTVQAGLAGVFRLFAPFFIVQVLDTDKVVGEVVRFAIYVRFAEQGVADDAHGFAQFQNLVVVALVLPDTEVAQQAVDDAGAAAGFLVHHKSQAAGIGDGRCEGHVALPAEERDAYQADGQPVAFDFRPVFFEPAEQVAEVHFLVGLLERCGLYVFHVGALGVVYLNAEMAMAALVITPVTARIWVSFLSQSMFFFSLVLLSLGSSAGTNTIEPFTTLG